MQRPLPFEQRRHERTLTVRTAKIRPSGALRFEPATTRDASEGGLLIDVVSPRTYVPGDEVEIVVAWSNEVVVRTQTILAKVSRVAQHPTGTGQSIGLAYASDTSAKDLKAA